MTPTTARLRGVLVAAGVLGPFAPLPFSLLPGTTLPVAAAAPASLVVAAGDISQLLTYGRFDPSLGFLSGMRVTLAPPPTGSPRIRLPGPRGIGAGGAIALNEFLRDGGPESAALFDRLQQPVALCIGGVRNGCGDGVDFADMPMRARPALSVPGDLPPPIVVGASAPAAEGERHVDSYLCPIHVPASFSCATAADPAPVNTAVAETLNERASITPVAQPDDDDALPGLGLLTGGIALAVMGAGLVVYRKAARGKRRRGRRF